LAATGFILPASVDLEALVGADFSTTINLYTDVAQTTAFDLTGYTVSMIIGSLFTLTSGSGLTITAASGLIVAALTATQTATVDPSPNPSEKVHYRLKLVDGSGVISFPLSGSFVFQVP
jgi:hypothetical protein